jgi:serine/threonine-protein kinase
MTVPMHERLAVALQERYLIERQPDGSLALLGRGGTATVFLAHDLRHDRPVALKVVHPELAASVGTERFLREIRTVARLSHPHILPLFDSGEADGLLYYVMPYVPGESLRRRLEREGRLPVSSAVRIACQVGLALDHAHRQGVVHRDIKPENILLDGDQAVVADFGIATAREAASGERLTEAGLAVGTPAYMSPEQAGGAPQVDGRSDVYSLGCVLYEMLGGAPPFAGPTPQAVMAQQVLATLAPIRTRRADVPVAVESTLAKALEKEPTDRFATAAEMSAALEGSVTPPPLPATLARSRRRTAALLGVGAIAATAFLFALDPQRQEPDTTEAPRIAVLPFDNLGAAEDGYFADGITEEITSRLAMIPTLGVISRTSAEQYRKTDKSIKEIGRELGVAYILEGSVRWEKSPQGSRVRVTPQLIRVSDDRHLWAGRFDETLEEVFEVQSRIAEQVAAELNLALKQPDHEALAAKPTDNLQAYDFYLRGNDLLTNAGIPDAINSAERMYVQATELDSGFALAFARLGRARIWQFHFSERTAAKLAAARAAVDSSLALDAALPEAHLALGQIYYWGELNYEAALREFRLAHAGDPGNGDIAWARGLVERRLGQWEQALASLRKAVELDPRSVVKHMDLFEVYLRQRQYPAAEQYVDRALALMPEAPLYVFKAMMVVTRDGDLNAATRVLEEGARKAGLQNLGAWTAQFDLGAALWHRLPDSAQQAVDQATMTMVGSDSAGYYLLKARMQRLRGNQPASRAFFDSARVVLEERTAARPDDPALRATLGFTYAGLGRREEAIREGRRAVELRPPSKDTWLGVDMVRSLATTYAMLGEADSAVRQLRLLLQVPSWISVPALRADPTWDPIRRDPDFRALVAKPVT